MSQLYTCPRCGTTNTTEGGPSVPPDSFVFVFCSECCFPGAWDGQRVGSFARDAFDDVEDPEIVAMREGGKREQERLYHEKGWWG